RDCRGSFRGHAVSRTDDPAPRVRGWLEVPPILRVPQGVVRPDAFDRRGGELRSPLEGGQEEPTNPKIAEEARRLTSGKRVRRLDSFDVDADLSDDVQALVGAVGRSVVDFRDARIHDRLGACDARLGGDEDHLTGIVGPHLDEGVHLRVDAATKSLLVRATIVMGQSFRGPVVAESVNLRHVLRGDDASDLETLARRPLRERHGEIHDQALEARSFDLPHQLASGPRAEESGARLKVSELWQVRIPTSQVICKIDSGWFCRTSGKEVDSYPHRTVWNLSSEIRDRVEERGEA